MWTTTFYLCFFHKYFVVHEQSAVEKSFSTYVCYAPDGLFWLNLYADAKKLKKVFLARGLGNDFCLVVFQRAKSFLTGNEHESVGEDLNLF